MRKKKRNLPSARDLIRQRIPIQPLDLPALPTSTVTQPTKDLRRLLRTKLKRRRRLRLQSRNRTTQLQHRFRLIHLFALEHEILKPVVTRFDLPCHVRELQTDDGVVDEFLTECLALRCVFHALFETYSAEAEALDDDADAFVVEVSHDNGKAFVLLAKEIFNGDFDVFEGDVGRATGPDSLAVHAAGRDAFGAFDEEQRDATHTLSACTDGGGEVVAPDPVGDPLLFAVDDVVLAVFGELGFAGEVCDVTAGVRLGDGETDTFLAGEDVWHDTLLEGGFAVFDEGWAADAEAADEVPY